LILFLLSLLPVYVYLGLRLATHWSHWILIGIIFAGILSFPFKKLFRYQLHLTYAGMAFLTYLTVFTILRDVIFFITGSLYPVIYVIILSLICCLYGFLNAVTGPRIKRVLVPVDNLKDELEGFKIAQISDLHIGATIRRPYVEKVVQKVNKLESDIIVLTGDIGDGKVSHYQTDVAPMSKLKSHHGTYFTPGNHEYYWNVNEWLGEMKKVGMTNLVNKGKTIKLSNTTVFVAGIPDPVGRVTPEFESLQSNADFKILLSHRPGIAREASEAGFHLTLSGHTHGGQFFPWTIVVKFVHKISQGLHRVGGMWIYVNPGTGSWGPLIRLGTTPEITLLTLTQSKSER
jgi:uncharacterized protein